MTRAALTRLRNHEKGYPMLILGRSMLTYRILLGGGLLGILLLTGGTSAQAWFFAGECMTDSEVPAKERSLYEQPALQFIQAFLGAAPESAYGELSDQAKASVSLDKFRQFSHLVPPLENLRVVHSYRDSLSTIVGTGPDQAVQCTTVAHGSIAQPEGRVLILIKPIPVQAHVLIQGQARNNSWGFEIWLAPDRNIWRVLSLEAMPVTILDKSEQDIWEMARQQNRLNHPFNAFVLYNAALHLAYRGHAFQLGIEPEIRSELASLQRPADLQGSPPFIWKASDKSFRVISLEPTAIGGKFALLVTQEIAKWGDNEYLERENHALLDVLHSVHPEYSQVFDAVVIEAVQQGGTQRHRTVEDRS